jgi:hypothetical protein
VTIDPINRQVVVSDRIKEEFQNGKGGITSWKGRCFGSPISSARLP